MRPPLDAPGLTELVLKLRQPEILVGQWR